MKSVGEGLLWGGLPGSVRGETLTDGGIVGNGALVVSIHDVSPLFEKEFNQWRRLLDRWGVYQRSLAVVPYHEESRRVSQSPSLVSTLLEEKRAGSEIVLHGYTHRFGGTYTTVPSRLRDRLSTKGCAEFSNLEAASAQTLISQGLRELRSFLPGRIRGFTAPGWWQSREVSQVLDRMGFLFYDSLWGLTDLEGERNYHAPVVTGLPGPKGLKASLLHSYNFSMLPRHLKKRSLVRVALHPYDLSNPVFVKAVGELLQEMVKKREVMVYEEYLS